MTRIPLNRSSEELEREFLYRALLDIKSEIAQLREVIVGGYILPNKRLTGRVPLEPTNYDILPNDIKPVDESMDVSFPTLREVEKNHIYHALEKSGGNKRKAAAILEISERTLYRKIKEFDLPF